MAISGGDQRQSEAIRGRKLRAEDPRPKAASRRQSVSGNQMSSAAIRGTHRVVTPHPRRIHQEGSALPMYELDACKLEPPRAQPRGKLAAARHVVGRERPNAARLMKDAIKRSSEVIRGHQRSSERPNAARLMTERVQSEPAEAIEAHQKPSEMSSESQSRDVISDVIADAIRDKGGTTEAIGGN